jgi:hypothetical protein
MMEMKYNGKMKQNEIYRFTLMTLFIFSALSLFGGVNGTKNNVELNILTFGAKGDGYTLNTKSIQLAIDSAAVLGGGVVVIPEGKFVSGSISLKTGVTLHLNQNGVLLGSTNPFDYVVGGQMKNFINADHANHISITGEGIINGRGRELALRIDSLFYAGKWNDPGYNFRRHRPGKRPRLLHFSECNHVSLEGITARNSANWVLNFDRCRNLTINRITVDSDDYWNNDGIDIEDCKNVRITNCYVNSADDGICLKSNPGNINDSIYIADCTVRSSASAIKFGTASHGGFKNVKIKNIFVFDTFRSAIALESVDGGDLENIEISDITASNTGNAIFIKLGHRNVDGEIGTLKNVSIKNVTVQVPFGAPDLKYQIRGPELNFFHNPFPASITGLPGHFVENVSLKNIRIIYPGRANKGYAYFPLYRLKDVPESESDYPEFHMFGELPSWGFYVRHVKGLSMKNIRLEVREYDFRPAFVFDDVHGLEMEHINVEGKTEGTQLIFRNVENHKTDLDNTKIKWVK